MSAVIQTLYTLNEYSSSGLTEVKAIVLSNGDSIYRNFDVDPNWVTLRLGFKLTMIGTPSTGDTLATHSNFIAGFCTPGHPVKIDPLTDLPYSGHFAGIGCRSAGYPYRWSRITSTYTDPSSLNNVAWGSIYSQCCTISGSSRGSSPTGATVSNWYFPRYETVISSSHPYKDTLGYAWISYVVDIQRETGGHNIGCVGMGLPATELQKCGFLHNIPKSVYRGALYAPDASPGGVVGSHYDAYFAGFGYPYIGSALIYSTGGSWTATGNPPQYILSESVWGGLSAVNFGYWTPETFCSTRIAIRDIVVLQIN